MDIGKLIEGRASADIVSASVDTPVREAIALLAENFDTNSTKILSFNTNCNFFFTMVLLAESSNRPAVVST